MEQSLLDQIGIRYNLSGLSFSHAPDAGISAKNAIVKAASGKLFFIKNYKKNDAANIENSEAVAQFISDNSTVPVLLPLINANGEKHTIIDDKVYSIFPYIEHADHKNMNEIDRLRTLEDLGRTLGMIHAVSQKTSYPTSIKIISSWIPEDTTIAISKFNEIKNIITSKITLDEYDIKALAFIELKLSLISTMRLEKRNTEPQAICHGDFHRGNILYDDEWNMLSICDWDAAGIANPYVEFIRSFNMCVIRRNFNDLEKTKESAQVFIEGYITNCGFIFNTSELEYAIESWYEKMLSTAWPLYDHYYLNNLKADASLDSESEKISFLSKNRKLLFENIKTFIN